MALVLVLAACGSKEEASPALPVSDLPAQVGQKLIAQGHVDEGLAELRRSRWGNGPPPWLAEVVAVLLRRRALAPADSLLGTYEAAVIADPALQYLRGHLASLEGRWDEAVAVYDAIVEPPALAAQAATETARLEINRHRLDQGIAAARRALRLEPGRPATLAILATGLLRDGRPRESLQVVQSMEPTPVRWTLEGEVLLALDRPQEAAQVLARAAESRNRDPQLRYLMGQAALRIDEPQLAVRALEALAASDPPFEDSQRLLAEAWTALGIGNPDSLQNAFDQTRRSREARSLRQQGLRLSGEGDNAAALDLFQRALELAPQMHELENDIGACLARLGRYDEAEQALLRASESAPEDPAVVANLANLYHLTDETEKSRAALARLRQLLAASAPAGHAETSDP